VPVHLEDICAAYREVERWYANGADNEDLGHELEEEVADLVRAFCARDGVIDAAEVKFVNSNSDIQLRVEQGRFVLEYPSGKHPHKFSA